MNKLKKIIKYAVERGWKGYWEDLPEAGIPCESHSVESSETCIYTLLFNHDFAKAVFGEKGVAAWIAWKWHLREAVISKDPIDYYYKYISDKGKNK